MLDTSLEVRAMPVVMDADRISRALTRIAHEILERNRGIDGVAPRRRAVPRRAARAAHRRGARHRQRRPRADRRSRHHAVPRRSDAHRGRAPAARPQDRDPVLDRRSHHHPGRRRALHRTDDAGGARRADRLRSARGRSSWWCWSTAATASCRSRPTTSARTCPTSRKESVQVRLRGARRRRRSRRSRREGVG